MNYLYTLLYVIAAIIVMAVFIQEVNLARKVRGLNQHWTLGMTVTLIIMSVLWPIGLFFLWLLANSNTNRYESCGTE